ncbi:acyl carrier protein [Kibdelosporangium banguiense]|uniref:Acyl carrier protein n=1 Tax=Kibdelosporangium banguiense TaxID=1365924 RepID=A0ABS4TG78_9PSEU|nr:phosphopantetheine-binding protein [Kibdelosporangium banguiense]MBP2323427.1 acyl carrier protein [Kibdelosporangium banguiense]
MTQPVVTREGIFAVITKNIATVIEGAEGLEVTETASMKDFGADSLEMVEVVSRSMKELRIKVPRTELSKASNLKELVDIFEHFAAAA